MLPWQKPKPILVLSDNPKLTQALARNLQPEWRVLEFNAAPRLQHPVRVAWGWLGLLLIALSETTTAPEGLLVHAGLADCLGRMPLLIIANPSLPLPAGPQVHQLNFPLSLVALRHKVQELLPVAPPPTLGAN